MAWVNTMANTIGAAALAAAMAMGAGAATTARADDMQSCRNNVDKWQSRLEHDLNRHGEESGQVKHDRHELDEARAHCDKKFGDRWRNRDDHRSDDDRNRDDQDHHDHAGDSGRNYWR